MGNCIASSAPDDRPVPLFPGPFRERGGGDGPGARGPRGPERRGAGAAQPGAPLALRRRIRLIQSLPRDVYRSDGRETKAPECAICLEDFVPGDPIRPLPCKHVYHLDCINEWLARSFTCPLCRGPAVAAEALFEDALEPGPLV